VDQARIPPRISELSIRKALKSVCSHPVSMRLQSVLGVTIT
jgi:hypothetical protein